jgi:hypothetical protein
MMKRLVLAACLVFFPSLSLAQAATVGPNCKLSWTAPTTHTDGSAMAASEITNYRVYVDKSTITPNVTPPTVTVAGTVTSGVQICAGLPAGNHTVAVSAVAGPNEGPASAQLPFVLVTAVPASPSNLQVLP